MAKYYYIGTFLPTLYFDAPSEINLTEFDNLLLDNLTVNDYRKTRAIRSLFDILNLRSLWLGEDLNPWGNLNEQELEEVLFDQKGLPSYVYDFLEAHEKLEDRLHHFPGLLASFFREAAEGEPEGFSRDYLNFEREWRLVFTGFRAKKLGRDLGIELQYENPDEELIAQMLLQKDAKIFEPPEKYHDLKVLFDKFSNDPLALERALDEYRFNYIENLVGMADIFSINRILAYMVQLMILQKWFALDKDKGVEIIATIVKELS
ncbi:MAG: DUF2764 family protein [Parachlamydiaceae bacterium]|nr:DUF2764 family protein [Parachlamydiaceae bacterium]